MFHRGAQVAIDHATIDLVSTAERHMSAILLEAAAEIASIEDSNRCVFLECAYELRQ